MNQFSEGTVVPNESSSGEHPSSGMNSNSKPSVGEHQFAEVEPPAQSVPTLEVNRIKGTYRHTEWQVNRCEDPHRLVE